LPGADGADISGGSAANHNQIVFSHNFFGIERRIMAGRARGCKPNAALKCN
jgi:hypothetical protein